MSEVDTCRTDGPRGAGSTGDADFAAILWSMKMDTLTLTSPDDMHLHLRDGDEMRSVVKFSAASFARAVIMPNLATPVTCCEQALQYRERILQAVATDTAAGMAHPFQPLMTLYLSDETTIREIATLAQTESIVAVKYYPAGATTHSDRGVRSITGLYPVLDAMQHHDVPLLLHGEANDPEVDIFDREARFIEDVLIPLRQRFPALRMVLEHISTQEAVDFINEAPPPTAATITPQHLLLNRNALFDKGLHPHRYCLPVLKGEHHRRAVLKAATGGSSRYFLGTDSAPHARHHKERTCAAAGIFSAHAALAFYAEAFDAAGQIHRLPAFASHHGADFYGLPRNTGQLTLSKAPWPVPETYPFADGHLVPLRAGGQCLWQIRKT